MAGCRGETLVEREEGSPEALGERDIRRVVRREILPERPDSKKQDIVLVAYEIKFSESVEREKCPFGAEGTDRDISAKCLRDFEVEKVRHMEGVPGRMDSLGDFSSRFRGEQQLEDRRSVENDQRLSRSARMTSAGDRSSRAGGSFESLSRISSRVGCASSFPISRSTYSDMDMPARAERAFSRR